MLGLQGFRVQGSHLYLVRTLCQGSQLIYCSVPTTILDVFFWNLYCFVQGKVPRSGHCIIRDLGARQQLSLPPHYGNVSQPWALPNTKHEVNLIISHKKCVVFLSSVLGECLTWCIKLVGNCVFIRLIIGLFSPMISGGYLLGIMGFQKERKLCSFYVV